MTQPRITAQNFGPGTRGAGRDNRTDQYVTFLCGGVVYAIPILQVQEIKGWGPVTAVPCAPPLLLGVMNLRGAVVPVVDLRRVLGSTQCAFDAETAVLLVHPAGDGKSGTAGLVVDSVRDVSSIDAEMIRAVPPVGVEPDNIALAGIAAFDDNMVLLIDVVPLIDAVSSRAAFGTGQGSDPSFVNTPSANGQEPISIGRARAAPIG